MRILCLALLMTCGSAAALAQNTGITGGIVFGGGFTSTVSVQPSLRADPPSSGLARRFNQSMRGRNAAGGPSFSSRYLVDAANHVILGYELVLEEQQPGTYLATFGKLGLTPLELSTEMAPRLPPNAPPGLVRPPSPLNPSNRTEWTTLPLPAIPEPRLVHPGDTISIDLFVDAATGEKLIDDIRIQPPRTIPSLAVGSPPALRPALANRPVPTVSGTARDFAATDAELQLAQPRVTLNGTPQSTTTGRAVANSRGSLVWFYLPDHGRYVLSLAPRPDLDFIQAGEVRGGVITFTVGDDLIKLECQIPVATGDAPYHLYVLHDPDWEPTAQAQKGQFATGSVDPGELAALKRK
jgi:hypothetical protein